MITIGTLSDSWHVQSIHIPVLESPRAARVPQISRPSGLRSANHLKELVNTIVGAFERVR